MASESGQPVCSPGVTSTQCAFAVTTSSGSVVSWGDADMGGDATPVQEQLMSNVSCHSDDAAGYSMPACTSVETEHARSVFQLQVSMPIPLPSLQLKMMVLW